MWYVNIHIKVKAHPNNEFSGWIEMMTGLSIKVSIHSSSQESCTQSVMLYFHFGLIIFLVYPFALCNHDCPRASEVTLMNMG